MRLLISSRATRAPGIAPSPSSHPAPVELSGKGTSVSRYSGLVSADEVMFGQLAIVACAAKTNSIKVNKGTHTRAILTAETNLQ